MQDQNPFDTFEEPPTDSTEMSSCNIFENIGTYVSASEQLSPPVDSFINNFTMFEDNFISNLYQNSSEEVPCRTQSTQYENFPSSEVLESKPPEIGMQFSEVIFDDILVEIGDINFLLEGVQEQTTTNEADKDLQLSSPVKNKRKGGRIKGQSPNRERETFESPNTLPTGRMFHELFKTLTVVVTKDFKGVKEEEIVKIIEGLYQNKSKGRPVYNLKNTSQAMVNNSKAILSQKDTNKKQNYIYLKFSTEAVKRGIISAARFIELFSIEPLQDLVKLKIAKKQPNSNCLLCYFKWVNSDKIPSEGHCVTFVLNDKVNQKPIFEFCYQIYSRKPPRPSENNTSVDNTSTKRQKKL